MRTPSGNWDSLALTDSTAEVLSRFPHQTKPLREGGEAAGQDKSTLD